jgi:hypothetical protein
MGCANAHAYTNRDTNSYASADAGSAAVAFTYGYTGHPTAGAGLLRPDHGMSGDNRSGR